jgi:hypothetical protein
MLSSGHSYAYNLTSRLLGDPKPTRVEDSEKIHQRLKLKTDAKLQVSTAPQRLVSDHVLECLRAIKTGHDTSAEISAATGISRDRTAHYLKKGRDNGWICVSHEARCDTGGRIYHYSLSEAGEAALEAGK